MRKEEGCHKIGWKVKREYWGRGEKRVKHVYGRMQSWIKIIRFYLSYSLALSIRPLQKRNHLRQSQFVSPIPSHKQFLIQNNPTPHALHNALSLISGFNELPIVNRQLNFPEQITWNNQILVGSSLPFPYYYYYYYFPILYVMFGIFY